MRMLAFAIPVDDVTSIIVSTLTSVYEFRRFNDRTFKIIDPDGKANIKVDDNYIYISGNKRVVDQLYDMISSRLQIKVLTSYRRLGRCTGVNCSCGMCGGVDLFKKNSI